MLRLMVNQVMVATVKLSKWWLPLKLTKDLYSTIQILELTNRNLWFIKCRCPRGNQLEIDCHGLYIFILLDICNRCISQLELWVWITRIQPNFRILSDLKIILIYLARKWGPNQVHTVRYQVMFSGYMSHCSSCFYLTPKHFLSANLIQMKWASPSLILPQLDVLQSYMYSSQLQNIYILNTKRL